MSTQFDQERTDMRNRAIVMAFAAHGIIKSVDLQEVVAMEDYSAANIWNPRGVKSMGRGYINVVIYETPAVAHAVQRYADAAGKSAGAIMDFNTVEMFDKLVREAKASGVKIVDGGDDVFVINGKTLSVTLMDADQIEQAVGQVQERLNNVDGQISEKAAMLAADPVKTLDLLPILGNLYRQQVQMEAQIGRMKKVLEEKGTRHDLRRSLRFSPSLSAAIVPAVVKIDVAE